MPRTSSPSPQDLIPLTPLSYQVLLTLAKGQDHGYGIAKAVAKQTGGRLKPGTGTLHSAVHRLAEDGLIAESASPPASPDGRSRRYWSLTPFGRDVFRAESVRLAELLEAAAATNLVPELKGAVKAVSR